MTGYGKGECTLADHSKITVEIKSLNGKNADISVKSQIIPKDKELEIRKLLANELVRGSIDFSLSLEMKNPAAGKQINAKAALSILGQVKDVQKKLPPAKNVNPKVYFPVYSDAGLTYEDTGMDDLAASLGDSISNSLLMASILRMPEVMETKQYEISAADWEKIDKAISSAIKKINSYRIAEGKALSADVSGRVANILSYLEEVKKLDVKRVPAIKERLRQKLDNAGIQANPERLEQELVFYVEKLDINEEKVRLEQHCKYFMDTIKNEPLAGKKLGFIVQEMGREINTLGSKANDASIQALVVRMKDELEKIREQSLNIL